MTSNAYRRAFYTSIIQVMANALMIAAIFLAMYQSFHHPSESLSVFCVWFFGITVPSWIVAKALVRFVRRRFADRDEGMVRLPGRRRSSLMHWKVSVRECVPQRVQIQS